MKFLTFLVLSVVFSETALARFIPDVELSLITSNGSVPSQNRIRNECKISGGIVTKVTTIAGGESRPIMKRVRWNGLVSDQRDMTSLLRDASESSVRPQPALFGGRYFTYDGAYRESTSSKMKGVHLKSTRGRNLSNEAKTLIEFIDINCK